jgi:hypothetical protein
MRLVVCGRTDQGRHDPIVVCFGVPGWGVLLEELEDLLEDGAGADRLLCVGGV